ncbi:MAG: hypothetical protein ACYSX1_13510 [Planctomycetota bacterium]
MVKFTFAVGPPRYDSGDSFSVTSNPVEIEIVPVKKTGVEVEDEEVRTNISYLLGTAFPASARNVQFYSSSFMETYIALLRFDITAAELQTLLAESPTLPDFPELAKNPEMKKRMEQYDYSVLADWWQPSELSEAVYGQWRASERARGGEGKVWVVQFVDIACGELANGLMRVYLQHRSHGHTIED